MKKRLLPLGVFGESFDMLFSLVSDYMVGEYMCIQFHYVIGATRQDNSAENNGLLARSPEHAGIISHIFPGDIRDIELHRVPSCMFKNVSDYYRKRDG